MVEIWTIFPSVLLQIIYRDLSSSRIIASGQVNNLIKVSSYGKISYLSLKILKLTADGFLQISEIEFEQSHRIPKLKDQHSITLLNDARIIKVKCVEPYAHA